MAYFFEYAIKEATNYRSISLGKGGGRAGPGSARVGSIIAGRQSWAVGSNSGQAKGGPLWKLDFLAKFSTGHAPSPGGRGAAVLRGGGLRG